MSTADLSAVSPWKNDCIQNKNVFYVGYVYFIYYIIMVWYDRGAW